MKKLIPFQLILISGLVVVLFAQCKSKNKGIAYEDAAVASPIMSKDNSAVTEAAVDAPMGNSSMPSPVPNQTSPTLDKITTDSIGKKIIKEGIISWETKNLKATNSWIKKTAAQYNAYISDESSSSTDYRTDYSIEIRLPAEQFDKFIAALESEVSDFDSKNITAKDVTEEYIDVYARIKTKKELEQRYFAILEKANKVEEILKTEEYLNNVRNEIESAEGRMRYLNDRINLSTIRLNFYQSSKVSHGFGREIIDSFSAGWKGVLNLILAIISIWPLLLLIGVVVYFILKRKFRRT